MEITINTVRQTIPSDHLLSDVLNTYLSKEITGIAVALNDRVITKSDWSSTPLEPNDEILIINAAQGG